MRSRSSLRVAVVGGGILGVSTAAALARHRVDVTVLTAGALVDGASGRSLAWLNSYGRRSPDYHRLRLLGLDRYLALARQVDASAYLRFDGALTWAAPGAEDRHRAAFAHMQQVGYAAQWVLPEDVPAVARGVDPAAVNPVGAIVTPDEGWVELPRLVRHLVGEVVRYGGRLRTDTGPVRVEVGQGRVTGVCTPDGDRVPCDAAVLATGAAVPAALAELGVHVPDATSVALLVRTAPLRSRLRAVLNSPRVSLRPSADGALVMDAGWSEEEIVVRENGTYEVADTTVRGLLGEASAVLEGHPELTVASCGVGPKPIPGDGEPVIGALPGVEGCHVAFTHSGATLGLVAGELLAEEVRTGEPHPLLAAFRPHRFT